jgi:hypothetical protein
MSDLIRQRCFLHASREAVARCPACKRFFCRECITEHAGRVICASCLKTLAIAEGRRAGGGWLAGARRLAWTALQCVAGGLLLWMFFYWLGRTLQLLPSDFHEGKLWEELMR